MKIFTIATETNEITAHDTVQEAEGVTGAERFRNEAALAKLAAGWPAARLIEIWNGLPGQTPVKKFKDRNTAVSRIWKAIQSLAATPTEGEPPVQTEHIATVVFVEPEQPVTPETQQTPDVAPVGTAADKKTSRAKKAPKPAQKAKGAREGSKTETVLALLRRKGGVTSKELMEATGWQPHSVRGFISGTVGKKMGLTVVSTKGENGDRNYTI